MFPEQCTTESQMDELPADAEPALTVFPLAPVFFQPRKAALDHPAPGHDLEGVRLAICTVGSTSPNACNARVRASHRWYGDSGSDSIGVNLSLTS